MKQLIFLPLAIILANHSIFSQEKLSKEIQEVSDELLAQITGTSAKLKLGKDSILYKVAIVRIDNEKKETTTFTTLLENKIAINLATKSFGKFDILDRNYIEDLMREKNLPLKYGNNADFAKDLGRVKAAHLMIVGTLSEFENDFELNLQVIETKEGNIIGGATGSLTATQLLKSKNQSADSKMETTNRSSNSSQKPVETITSNVGTVIINNKTRYSILILMGTDQVEPSNYNRKYEELTVAGNSTDNFEAITPGSY